MKFILPKIILIFLALSFSTNSQSVTDGTQSNKDKKSSQTMKDQHLNEKSPLISNSTSPKEPNLYGAWSYECREARCFVSQSLLAKNGTKVGVVAGISIAKANRHGLIMTIRFSKLAELKAGIGLKVDDNKPIKTKILKCDAKVCETNVIMDSQLIQEMQQGKVLQVAYFNKKTRNQTTLPFSLAGLKGAIAKLNLQ